MCFSLVELDSGSHSDRTLGPVQNELWSGSLVVERDLTANPTRRTSALCKSEPTSSLYVLHTDTLVLLSHLKAAHV